MLVLGAADVYRVLSMQDCIEAMSAAMKAVSSGAVGNPPRLGTPLGGDGDGLLLMPAMSADVGAFSAKVVSIIGANPARGLPAIQGLVTLFDGATGTPLALIEGAALTAIRTAAASALATQWLAREDARSLGLFGCGVQAASHLDAIAAVRRLDRVVVWGRDPEKARCFADEQGRRTGLRVQAVAEPDGAAACDIVCTVTGATEPVLMGRWVRPGAHVNLVGAHAVTAREADTALIASARVYVDLLASMRDESGDIMIPVQEGAIAADHVVGEIGALVAGALPGRTDGSEVTVYKSLGVAVQDLYAANEAYRQALAMGVGCRVSLA